MISQEENNPRPTTAPMRLGWVLVVVVVLLQMYARYLPSPWAVFVADDWSNYARSTMYSSHSEALAVGLQNPNRPVSTAAVEVVYRLFGDNPLPWTLLSLVANTLLLTLVMKLVLELTARRETALLAGVCFALLPNLTETYHWSTQIVNQLTCAMVFYVLSGWLWVAYVRRGGGWRLALSAIAYGIGLSAYEAGALLPAAYLVLLTWKRPVYDLMRCTPFGVMVVLYAAWRITDAFGMNEVWHFSPQMEAGLSVWGISWNARQVIHWWAGDNFFNSLLEGWKSFATLAPWTRRILALCNAIVALILCYTLHRRVVRAPYASAETERFHGVRIWLFGLVWIGAAFAVLLVSYTASRLMILPAVGIVMLVALTVEKTPSRSGIWLLGVFPVLLALIATQGTAENFRQAGELNQRLYRHLEASHAAWRDQDILLFDTRDMRQRLTPGLLRSVGDDQATWAFYGNAALLRGFVPGGMIRLITGEKNPRVSIVHDVEHGARVEGDTLHWHARYDPGRPRTTPMSRVHVVDVHAVATGN